jgi:hypothetical protein
MRQKSGGHSVAESGRDLNPAPRLASVIDFVVLHPSHICHIAATDQGHFSPRRGRDELVLAPLLNRPPERRTWLRVTERK